jgi:hypothetical protein
MRTGGVVVDNKFLQHMPKMGFIENDELIQTLLTNRSYPPLGKGIGVGSAKGCEQNSDAF